MLYITLIKQKNSIKKIELFFKYIPHLRLLSIKEIAVEYKIKFVKKSWDYIRCSPTKSKLEFKKNT
jgi:hypothetical protein